MYDCAEGHPLKKIIHLLKHTARIVDILSQSLGALLAESKVSIYLAVFVVASQ